MKEADKSRVKAVALKAIEDFQSFIEFAMEKKTVAAKVVKDFWVSKEFQDEKANFAITAYEEAMKDAQGKVIIWCPILDLGFLDKLLAPKEGKVVIDASKDVPILAMADVSRGGPTFAP